MSKDLLRQLNRNIRNLRPKYPTDTVCAVFQEKRLLEIGFLSNRCRNDLNGSCIMCDYGCAVSTQEQEKYLGEMKNILDHADSQIECLLLCTNGSFFDETQISPSLFEAIITLASKYQIPTIEFETHYLDVSPEKLSIIRKVLYDKHVMIEMGLESVNMKYQDNVIMKNIDLHVYEQTISMIHDYGFEVETNIMVGLPFLSSKEQMEEAYNAIMWSFTHQCKVVLFPVNIKPYTVLMQMYEKRLYFPISHWMLILLLDSIPDKDLDKITIAWYGNREEKYSNMDTVTIFPTACPQCKEKLKQFYSDFLEKSDCQTRKNYITQLLKSCRCECLNNQIQLINNIDNISFDARYVNYCNMLREEFIDKE